MNPCLLVISGRDEDIQFGKTIAETNQFAFYSAASANDALAIVLQNPSALVLWDVDHPGATDANHPLSVASVAKNLDGNVDPGHVFVLAEKALNQNPQLLDVKCFGHHIYRRFADPAPQVFAHLLAAALVQYPFGTDKYFAPGAKTTRFSLGRSGEKEAAVQRIQDELVAGDIKARIASQVAQAADELIMNAVFDAPTGADGKPSRRSLPRSEDFELKDRDVVEVEVVSSDTYSAVSVVDHFGSVKRDIILKFLRQDFSDKDYTVRTDDPGAGLGLHGVLQAGLSLLFVSKPGERTEVTLFFPKCESYKAFREGFRFLSFFSS